jgi:hypothetical protein
LASAEKNGPSTPNVIVLPVSVEDAVYSSANEPSSGPPSAPAWQAKVTANPELPAA